ncbi:hypothetical protein BAU15_08670 [Enterococcus sp. JM4C]|uniref:NusG domain II-containing protein n=1 Tax=Candidatus Enterococcus huntleyi TaxID=1857217 RepID=UPI0013794FC6|nr:NusG domain II-containing protein [Enterococcus sp. JM4C]KAF1297968.1 hypothetical protein BAU15_08670 [Enterococcus sp. JM4C]
MNWREFIKKSRLKPWDIVIITGLILVSFAPLVVFALQQESDTEPSVTKQAVLRVDGEEIKTFDLIEGQESYTYTYEDEHGDYNVIEVSDGMIRIKEADCGDQICVRQGWAKKNGETRVCLPHKLVLEVQSSDGSDEGSLIY